MRVFEYQRVSTDKQTQSQQHNAVEEYCKSNGLSIYKTITDSGVSGGVPYKNRKLAKMLDLMEEGDMLIVSEISRLGRSMSDLSILMSEELKPRKLKLIAVKNGISLNCQTMTAVDEFIISALAFCSQIEKDMIRQRTKSSLDVIKSEIKKSGVHVTKKGRTIVKLGNPRITESGGCCEKGNEASCASKKAAARANPNNVLFVKLHKQYRKHNPPLTTKGCAAFVEMLNDFNAKTATGLDFNEQRCWSMYQSLKRQGILTV